MTGVKTILDGGASANCYDYDHRTPLHLAASEGQLDCCKELVLRGASVHTKDRFGNTPLTDALLAGHDDVCEFLRQVGAKVAMEHERLTYLACK